MSRLLTVFSGYPMLSNHVGLSVGGRMATLSYSFVVHCNVDEAVMHPGENEWWIQEWSFTRAGAGRGLHVSKIWSPKGAHVATEFQDGLLTDGRILPPRPAGREKL